MNFDICNLIKQMVYVQTKNITEFRLYLCSPDIPTHQRLDNRLEREYLSIIKYIPIIQQSISIVYNDRKCELMIYDIEQIEGINESMLPEDSYQYAALFICDEHCYVAQITIYTISI